MKHPGIIVIALMLLCIGIVSAEEWEWATEETGYPEEYLQVLRTWYPTLGFERPVHVYQTISISEPAESRIPEWMQEGLAQMHERHRTSSRDRSSRR